MCLAYAFEERRNYKVLRDVLPSVDDERRNAYEMQTVDDRPVLQNPAKQFVTKIDQLRRDREL